MTIGNDHISKHAAQRMAQRNVSLEDLAIVLRYGQKHHRTGGEIYFLAANNLPKGTEKTWARLVGTFAVVVDDCVMTVVRNRQHGAAKIKRKPKRARR